MVCSPFSQLFDEDVASVPEKLPINKTYAASFEKHQRQKDLQRNQHLITSDASDESDGSTSSSEDENARLLTQKVYSKVLNTIGKIATKDQSVYDSSNQFFNDSDFSDPEDIAKSNGKDEKVTYKDFVRDALLKEGATAFLENDDAMASTKFAKKLSYREEQASLKNSFLIASEKLLGDVNADDSLLQVKKKTEGEINQENQDFQNFLKNQPAREQKSEEVIRRYFASDSCLSSEDKFLRDYLVNQKWLEHRPIGHSDTFSSLRKEDEDDNEHLAQTDLFEKAYNFRFEEPDGTTLMTYSRSVNSIRNVNDKRIRNRQEKKLKKEQEKIERKKEIKRLKELKQIEIDAKVQQLAKVLGKDPETSNFEADFNPDTHDAELSQLIGESFEEEVEEMKYKQFSKLTDDIMEHVGTEEIQQEENKKLTKKAKKLAKILEKKRRKMLELSDDQAYMPLVENENAKINEETDESLKFGYDDTETQENEDGEDGDEDDVGEWWCCDSCQKGIPAGQKRFDCLECKNYTLCKQCFRIVAHEHQMIRCKVPSHCQPPKHMKDVAADQSAVLGALMNELKDIEYEDIIGGDVRTKFSYASVEPCDYGFSVDDILNTDDSILKKAISIKKMAPYRNNKDLKTLTRATIRKKKLLFKELRKSSHKGILRNGIKN